jgi:hypothetical protein
MRSVPPVLPGRFIDCSGGEVVGLSPLPSHTVRQCLMPQTYDTGMELLVESAQALELAGSACDSSEDADAFFALAQRVRNYLSQSRATTTLGMPRIISENARLSDERVMHRTAENDRTYIRILPD